MLILRLCCWPLHVAATFQYLFSGEVDIGSMEAVDQFQVEKTQIQDSLKELEFIDLEDWIKIIPVNEIETISLFDEVAYGKWFSVPSPVALTQANEK